MREIKFRAWDKNADRMLHFDTTNIMMTLEGIAYLPDDIEPNGFRNIHKQVELMQYTGLKDKNGKEIYEGDLLHNSMDKEPFYIIQWDSRNACFELGDDGNKLSKFAVHEFWEVIGNIYNNPELIKAVE